METARSRFLKVFRGEKPTDRLPVMEWASWWNLTVDRWKGEGLPGHLDKTGIKQHFGLDIDQQLWFPQMKPGVNRPPHGKNWISNSADYETLRSNFYPHLIPYERERWRQIADEQARGECVVWITLEGFFWWPRVLFGIEPHLFAFYDEPKLMHRINQDNLEYMLRCLEDFCSICVPDFMTFAEDMSYNHGPMISKACFDEFLAPYYRQVIPRIRKLGILPMIDSDGNVEPMLGWLEDAGMAGILPLERMAGVDIARIRSNYPKLLLIGCFDKTVMHCGEAAIRGEFERLLPVMRSGYFVPSVDHQTPPAVSIPDYQLYLKLLREYCERAVR
jgi:hypothetical protein